jgi:hypothetical protein
VSEWVFLIWAPPAYAGKAASIPTAKAAAIANPVVDLKLFAFISDLSLSSANVVFAGRAVFSIYTHNITAIQRIVLSGAA